MNAPGNPPDPADTPAALPAADPEPGASPEASVAAPSDAEPLPTLRAILEPGEAEAGTNGAGAEAPAALVPAVQSPAAPAADEAPAVMAAPGPRWRAGVLWLGIAAVVLGLIGEHFLTSTDGPPDVQAVLFATGCYALGIAVMLFGWHNSDPDRMVERIPQAAQTTIPVRWAGAVRSRAAGRLLRFGGAMIALSTNVWALRLLRADWTSWTGLLLWAASLVTLVLVVLGERPAPAAPVVTREPDSPWHVHPLVEVLIFAGILLLAFSLRADRLGDLAPGLHGDEGEAGTAALNILHGNLVSPFTPGWFNQSNFYYWSIALGMKLFGTGLVGLRAFAVLCGLVTVGFVYGVARESFGLRAAIIAGCLTAVGSADILLSRQEFSNATLPAFFAAAFYFLVRGLRTTRHVNFVLAGLAAGLAGYYFIGGWLVPLAVGAVLAYLALTRRGFLAAYGSRVGAFLLALFMIGAPFWTYFADHPIPDNQYPNGILIWSNYDLLAVQYNDDNWATILGDHLTRTLSLLTYRPDASTLGILDYPPLLALESVLVVLGLAWATWRWRDTRFAVLLCWFWVAALGGLLTIDAPNLPRLAGILPALALVMAAWLDHLAAQVPHVTTDFGRWPRLQPAGQWLGVAVVAGVLGIAGVQHANLYVDYYLNTAQSPDVTMQASIVQQLGPDYHYYDLGAPLIYWGHGDNRFLNPTADGSDLLNVADDLPLTDNGANADQGAVFLVWDQMHDYLPILQAYYPEAISNTIQFYNTRYDYRPLTTYTVSAAQIAAHRVLHARYTPASGTPVARDEGQAGLGPPGSPGGAPPTGLAYPVAATWDGGLIAPTYKAYQFRLTAPPGAQLTIDGLAVLTTTLADQPADGSLILARGLHTIHLSANLPDAGARVDLLWSETGTTLKHIDRRYLWDNHTGAGWLGEIHAVDPADPLGGDGTEVQHGQRGAQAASERVDAFLGFRDAGQALGLPQPAGGIWTAALDITATGVYTFDLNSDGVSELSVDGQQVVDNSAGGADAHQAQGSVGLGAGRHSIEVRYAWLGGSGILECSWTQPDSTRSLLFGPAVQPSGPGAWISQDMVYSTVPLAGR